MLELVGPLLVLGRGAFLRGYFALWFWVSRETKPHFNCINYYYGGIYIKYSDFSEWAICHGGVGGCLEQAE